MTESASTTRQPTAEDNAAIEAAAAAFRLRSELEGRERRAMRREGLLWGLFEAVVTGLANGFAAMLPWLFGGAVVVVGAASVFGISLKAAAILMVALVIGLAVLAVASN